MVLFRLKLLCCINVGWYVRGGVVTFLHVSVCMYLFRVFGLGLRTLHNVNDIGCNKVAIFTSTNNRAYTMSAPENNNVDYLATLPYDVIAEMVSHMSITTVDKLKKEVSYMRHQAGPGENKYEGVQDASKNRKSVAKYLNAHFGDGTKLLEAMSRYYVYISGSRSLEFFDEGHVDESSDWDMYVPNWPGHVIGVMQELEELGVTWMSPEEEVADIKASGQGSLVLDSCKFRYMLENNHFAAENDNIADLIRLSRQSAFPNVTLNFDEGKCNVTLNEEGDGYVSENITCIIRGELNYKGKTTRVQLIVESRGENAASIIAPFTYHSSCVQSFIGPYSACHMYGKLTSEGKSYGWRGNVSPKARERLGEYKRFEPVNVAVVPGWSKYSARGFEYINPAEFVLGFDLRTAKDDDCVWLEYDDHTKAPRDVIALYKQTSKALSWFQVAETTVPVRFPITATYGHEDLDFGFWFDRGDVATAEAKLYLDKYIPYLKCYSDGVLHHIRIRWDE